jgi:hypothetical protein
MHDVIVNLETHWVGLAGQRRLSDVTRQWTARAVRALTGCGELLVREPDRDTVRAPVAAPGSPAGHKSAPLHLLVR